MTSGAGPGEGPRAGQRALYLGEEWSVRGMGPASSVKLAHDVFPPQFVSAEIWAAATFNEQRKRWELPVEARGQHTGIEGFANVIVQWDPDRAVARVLLDMQELGGDEPGANQHRELIIPQGVITALAVALVRAATFYCVTDGGGSKLELEDLASALRDHLCHPRPGGP